MSDQSRLWDEANTAGRKKEPSTLQSRFGFQDAELKTPQHDEMMLWLDQNMKTVLGNLLPEWGEISKAAYSQTADSLKKAEIRELYDYAREAARIATIPDPPYSPNVLSFSWETTWEKPIMSGHYMVGFVDMSIQTRLSSLSLYYRDSKWEWHETLGYWLYCFEVKPKIPSLGELIRQIRMYAEYVHDKTTYVVVCPDDRFASTLATQGIAFVRYPENV